MPCQPDEVTPTEHFYRRLLALSSCDHLQPLLDDALRLIVEITAARLVYIEIYEADDHPNEAAFWRAHQCSSTDAATIRDSISRGIIGNALAEGRTTRTSSALNDERFKDLGSVRRNEIEAVLCAPVGIEFPVGAIYLQGRPGTGSFSEADEERVEGRVPIVV